VIAGIRAILTEIRTRLPESKILVFSIFPRKAGQESEVVEAVNAMLPQLADGTKIVHKDINAAFLDEEGKQRTELYHRDLLHLNSKGYESWAAALLPLLREFRLTRSENEE